MALLDLLKNGIQGFKGVTPSKRPGALADNDIHVQNGVHSDSHSSLDLPSNKVNKYLG